MIGMEDNSTLIKNGSIAECVIISVGPTPAGLNDMKASMEIELKKAAALGTNPEPVIYSAKKSGLAVQYAVISVDGEKVVTGYDPIRLPNYSFTGYITQLPLSEVWARCVALKSQGKEFGYNFQKNGGGNSFTKAGSPAIVALHPNPNVEKDWDSGVSALTAANTEQYSALLSKEADRLVKWEKIVSQWNGITEEQAVSELYQGLSRRMLLYTISGNKPVYVNPLVGMVFKAKVVRKDDSKYFDLCFFEYEKETKTFICFANKTESGSFVIDEETQKLASDIFAANEQAREAYKAKQASVSVETNITEDEWE